MSSIQKKQMDSPLFNNKIISQKSEKKSSQIQDYLQILLKEYQDAFAKSENDFGNYKLQE